MSAAVIVWHGLARWTTSLVAHDVREVVVLSDRLNVLAHRPSSVIVELIVSATRPRLGQEARPVLKD